MFFILNPLQNMPGTYRRCKTSTLSLQIALCWIFCMGYQISYAKDNTNDQITQQAMYGNKDFWSVYPVSVQLSPHFGIMLPIRLQDVAKNNELSTKMLIALGGKADIGLLYARRWLWEHFDCYPKLGLQLKYDFITNNNVLEKGHIVGGVFYIEPNFNHLDGWEILPRAGVGFAYLNIPGGFSSIDKTPADEEEEVEPDSAADVDPFRQEVDLDIILDIMVKYRLTPNWHFHFSLGVDYFPVLFTDVEDDTTSISPRAKKAIEIFTASLGCSYTFNPSQYNPVRMHRHPRNLVSLALLNSFRKAYPININTNAGGNQQQNSADTPDKYYYLGGLHVQWSYQLASNHALVFGSEWVKDWALKKELENKLKRDNLQVSLMAGHEFIWGQLNFGQYIGFYVHNNANSENERQFTFNEIAYARFGLNYRITDYLYVGTSLKVSILPTNKDVGRSKQSAPMEYTRLDYVDFRVGFTF